MTLPIACGDSLTGCSTPPEQLEKLLEAGKKYKAYRYWDRIRIGRSQQDITGNGFNAIRFDPRKPAHTIRRMDSNLGMGGAMRWDEKRRFSLPEFKRFGSFPDDFIFSGEFEEGIKQIGNCVPPLFMLAIAKHIRRLYATFGKNQLYTDK
jgi:DNA (cytosine-5)-methyltransferase 1